MSFGSPAADYIEPKLDLNRLLAPHPVSTYFLRMDTDRLLTEGIKKGDILVIDRSCPKPEESSGSYDTSPVPQPASPAAYGA